MAGGKHQQKQAAAAAAKVSAKGKKAFDKKKWRENRYSHKVRVDRWEEGRQKSMERKYFKMLQKEARKKGPEQRENRATCSTSSERLPAGGQSPDPSSERLPAVGQSPDPSSERPPVGNQSPDSSSERLPAGGQSPDPSSERLPAGGQSPDPSSERLPVGGQGPDLSSSSSGGPGNGPNAAPAGASYQEIKRSFEDRKRKAEKDQREDEKRAVYLEKREAVKAYLKRVEENQKIFGNMTPKGQPSMAGRMRLLLRKIKESFD